jgi:hypothetical protein
VLVRKDNETGDDNDHNLENKGIRDINDFVPSTETLFTQSVRLLNKDHRLDATMRMGTLRREHTRDRYNALCYDYIAIANFIKTKGLSSSDGDDLLKVSMNS